MRILPFLPVLCLATTLALASQAGAATLGFKVLPGRYPSVSFLPQNTTSALSPTATSGVTLTLTPATTAAGGTLGLGGNLIKTGAGTLQLGTNTTYGGWLQTPSTYNATLGSGANTTTITLTDPIVLWNNVNALTLSTSTGSAGALNLTGANTNNGALTLSGGRIVINQGTLNTGALIHTNASLNTAALSLSLSASAVNTFSAVESRSLIIQRNSDFANVRTRGALLGEIAPVPEPSTMALAVAGLAMILGRRSRRITAA